MMNFIKKIKQLYAIALKIDGIEKRLEAREKSIEKMFEENSKLFEEKIKTMSFNYTKNLDDTKSDYLKRYLEVKMNCMEHT